MVRFEQDTVSHFADAENKTQVLEDIEKILSNKTDVMIKTWNLLENMDLFNWRTNVPFDIYMVRTCSECEFEFEASVSFRCQPVSCRSTVKKIKLIMVLFFLNSFDNSIICS